MTIVPAERAMRTCGKIDEKKDEKEKGAPRQPLALTPAPPPAAKPARKKTGADTPRTSAFAEEKP